MSRFRAWWSWSHQERISRGVLDGNQQPNVLAQGFLQEQCDEIFTQTTEEVQRAKIISNVKFYIT